MTYMTNLEVRRDIERGAGRRGRVELRDDLVARAVLVLEVLRRADYAQLALDHDADARAERLGLWSERDGTLFWSPAARSCVDAI